MLLSPTAVGTVSEILGAADFYRESHAKIFRAALGLWGKGEPVDAITLANELDERSELETIGGQAKVAELAALVPSTSNVEHYARIVKEMATLRGLVRAGQEITRLGQERPGEVTDLVDRAEQIVFELGQQRVTSDFAHIETLLKESFERITQLYEAGSEITGIPSGFRELDLLTSGFQPGNLVIPAARPWGSRRSASASRRTWACATRPRRPLHPRDVEGRGDAADDVQRGEGRVPAAPQRPARPGRPAAPDDRVRPADEGAHLRRRHRFDDDHGAALEGASPQVAEPSLGLSSSTTSADDLGRPSRTASRRCRRSRALKVLARDLDVLIVAMSQLRARSSRVTTSARSSPTCARAAARAGLDLVAFVYRDEYYLGEESTQGIAEIHLSKHRNGPTGTVKLSFLRRYAKFADLAA